MAKTRTIQRSGGTGEFRTKSSGAQSTGQSGKLVVRDATNGQFVTVHGAGALKKLKIKKGVDLTKPIYEQAAEHDQVPRKRR